MAARRHIPIQITHLIQPSIYTVLNLDNLAPEYAATLATLVNENILTDTITHNYTAFITAILGNNAIITPNENKTSGNITGTHIGSTTTSNKNSSNVSDINNLYQQFENYILSIIQYITDGMALDSILNILQPLLDKIDSAAAAASTINTIQTTMLGLFETLSLRGDISGNQSGNQSRVDTLSTRFDISGIQQRLDYLQSLLLIDTNLEPVYNEINSFLVAIIDQIKNKQPYLTLLEQLTTGLVTLQLNMLPQIQLADDMLAIQETIISIINNIIKGVDLNLVLSRLQYVTILLTNAAAITIN